MADDNSGAVMAERTAGGGLWDYFKQHPIGFWFFFWGEFAERCCFYGAKVILPLFIVQVIGRDSQFAQSTVYYFVAACYFAPIIGGWIADNYLGKYRTILFFSIPYIVGQWLLVFGFLHKEIVLYLSLVLLAIGSGVIKPNISTLMGMTYDQKRPGNTALRSDAFSMFYMAINIGSALSTFAMPAVRDYYGKNSFGYGMAFLCPAILMVIALFIFAIGKPYYAEETIWRKQKISAEDKEQRAKVLTRIAGLFGIITIFWMIFDQSQVTWTFTTRDCIHLELFGLHLGPDQIQAMNPVFIVIFVPVMTLVWHWFIHRGREVVATRKMVIGFCLTTLSMLVMAYVGFSSQSAAKRVAADQLLPKAEAALTACTTQIFPTREIPATTVDEGTQTSAEMVQNGKTPRILPQDADDAVFMTMVNAAAAAAAEHAITLAKLVYNTSPDTPGLQGQIEAEVAASEKLIDGVVTQKEKDAMSEAQRKEVFTTAAAGSAAEAEAFAERWGLSEMINDAAGRSTNDTQRHAARDASVAIAQLDGTIDKAKSAVCAVEVGNLDAYRTRADMTTLYATESVAAFIDLTGDVKGGETLFLTAAQGKASILWLIVAFFLITIAEICISIVGLELAFAVAPPSMKSFVSGCWLATVGIANIFNAWVAALCDKPFAAFDITHGWYYLSFAIILVPMTWLLSVVARRFNNGSAA